MSTPLASKGTSAPRTAARRPDRRDQGRRDRPTRGRRAHGRQPARDRPRGRRQPRRALRLLRQSRRPVHRADRRRLQRRRRRRRVHGGGPAARRPRRTPLGRHPGVPGMGARQPVVVPPPLFQPRARLRAAGRRRGPHRHAARLRPDARDDARRLRTRAHEAPAFGPTHRHEQVPRVLRARSHGRSARRARRSVGPSSTGSSRSEINGHIDPHWVDAAALFAANVRSSIREMGLPLEDG